MKFKIRRRLIKDIPTFRTMYLGSYLREEGHLDDLVEIDICDLEEFVRMVDDVQRVSRFNILVRRRSDGDLEIDVFG